LVWLSGTGIGRNLLWLLIVYLAVFIITIVVVVGVLAALPVNYFQDDAQPRPLPQGGIARVTVRVLKNVLGLVLIMLGVVLSLPGVPGQGLLTVLIGLMLMDFPVKRRLEQKLVARRGVLHALNRARAWLGRPPMEL
jgi:hypothetical protein